MYINKNFYINSLLWSEVFPDRSSLEHNSNKMLLYFYSSFSSTPSLGIIFSNLPEENACYIHLVISKRYTVTASLIVPFLSCLQIKFSILSQIHLSTITNSTCRILNCTDLLLLTALDSIYHSYYSHIIFKLRFHSYFRVVFTDQLRPNNCIGVLHFARHYFCKDLERRGRLYVIENFPELVKLRDQLCLMYPEELTKVLQDDELNIKNEEVAVDAVRKWIEFDPSTRKVYLMDLMKSVRLGRLTPIFLKGLLTWSLVLENEVSSSPRQFLHGTALRETLFCSNACLI